MTHRVHILHVRVVSGSGGGPDKTIARSAKYLDANRFDVASAYLYPRGDAGIDVIRAAHAKQGQSFIAIPERGPMDLTAVRALARLCRERHIDIWHGHDYKSDLLGVMMRRWHPMKLVTTVHGFTRETARTRFYARLNNLALPRYDHVAAVSQPLMQHCLHHGVDPTRLTYLPNGVEIDLMGRSRDVDQAKAALSIDRRTLVIGVVARLSHEKGVDRAVSLLANLNVGPGLPGHVGRSNSGGVRASPDLQEMSERAPHDRIQLHIIGDGPRRGDLEAQAAAAGVAEDIRWWGWQTDPGRFYEAMDMLLLPSRTEGLPNAALEAMAMGVPVVATRVGAMEELLDEGRCGLLLSEDEAAWPAAVTSVLNDPDRCRELAAAASQRIEEHYSFARRMEKVAEIYERVLGESTAPRLAVAA